MFCLVGNDNVLEEVDDALLLVAWHLADLVEESSQFASGAAALSFREIDSEQVMNGNIEQLGELGQVFRSYGNGFTFPISITWLADPDGLGHIGLGQAFIDSGYVETLSELGSLIGF